MAVYRLAGNRKFDIDWSRVYNALREAEKSLDDTMEDVGTVKTYLNKDPMIKDVMRIYGEMSRIKQDIRDLISESALEA